MVVTTIHLETIRSYNRLEKSDLRLFFILTPLQHPQNHLSESQSLGNRLIFRTVMQCPEVT